MTSQGISQPRGVKRPRARSTIAPSQPPKQRKTSPELQQPENKGIIPNWQSPQIPYEAWADIFIYAASDGTPDSLDTNWLILAATTCRMFAKPALTAIYRCPPIRTQAKAKRLAALLERSPSETCINYRARIESLYIDVQTVPQVILFDLIRVLPRLRELIFFARSDQPPYRELDKPVRWNYPEEVFRALMPAATEDSTIDDKSLPTFLKSWEWSHSLMGSNVTNIQDISRIHQTPPFSHLTRLSFTNFQVPSLHKPQPKPGDEEAAQLVFSEDNAVIEAIGDAISHVKGLKHLVFESSTVMNDRLLLLLPKDLVHLELINCWEIKSEDFAPFLRTHGSKLRTLSLLHNQSLDLTYLTDLAETCPNLEELHMNLSYYRHHETVDDGDPMYDQALYPGQVPRWPRSLRVIDFEHIRDWSGEAADTFLQSLIDQAEFLPDLRRLTIKTILDIPWQARATMRREWGESLERVFLRPFESPKRITSLRQPAITDPADPGVTHQKKRQTSQLPSPSRRSGRLSTQDPAHGPSPRGSKSLRHGRDKPLYREPDTDEDEFDVSESEDDLHSSDETLSQPQGDNDETKPFTQGMCTTVSFTCDNQKVRELQYGMEDFRTEDNGVSEEEWNGDLEEDDAVMVFR